MRRSSIYCSHHRPHSADALSSLDDYIDRASDEQEVIYYLSTRSLDKARRSPHLEAFNDENIEVIFFADHVDEIWLQERAEYKGKTFKSITEGELDLSRKGAEPGAQSDDEHKTSTPDISELLLAVRSTLQDEIKDVRTSSRLRSSPACLVTATGDLTPQIERLMRATGQEVPKTKRILELNPNHPPHRANGGNARGRRLGPYGRQLRSTALRPSDTRRRG